MRAFCPPKNTPEKDIVMTPEYLAKEIINHYNPTGKILDPSRGEGAFYDNYDTDNKDSVSYTHLTLPTILLV